MAAALRVAPEKVIAAVDPVRAQPMVKPWFAEVMLLPLVRARSEPSMRRISSAPSLRLVMVRVRPAKFWPLSMVLADTVLKRSTPGAAISSTMFGLSPAAVRVGSSLTPVTLTDMDPVPLSDPSLKV